MDDSDQDFVDLCAKLLKRVHKKPGEPRQPRKAEHQPSSQANDGDKTRNNKRDGDSGSKFDGSQAVCTGAEAEQHAIRGGSGYDSGDAGPTALPAPATPRAKDKVIQRMQQFKRASPQRIVNRDKSQTTNHVNGCVPSPPLVQRRDTAESFSSGLHPEPQDSDEALALRLQEELDREAAEAQTVDLEDGGLFFCQICQRDLTHMTPKGRTQHLNRCLDESEKSGPAPPPPPAAAPGVPDCPICGKKFKSQKSRSAHLKRCSSDMGISPAVLLQALQRQAEENQNVYAANTLTETGGTKRKGLPKAGLPANKKSRKKNEPLDEDTMVALTLSSSLLEQERKSERELEPGAVSMTAALKWRPDAGRGHVKRKKGTHPCPPPLLLVQDSEAALTRLQERVSALLLRTRAPSPPTPTLCPSSLLGWSGAAPLWQKSALLDGGSTCVSDFYTPELREFITPWESATAEAASSSTGNKPESSVQPVSEGTPLTGTRASVPPSSPQATASPAPSTPGTGQLPVGSQTLRDLMELAEDGMTLTQGGYTATGPDKEKGAGVITNVHLSGFVLEESEEQADLCVSGFLPETTHTCSDDTHSQAKRTTDQPGADTQRGPHQSVVLSRLASDLSSMVNNPQLSDVQLQVDSGEVYFAHSFMVYARCPLLAEMVHESGFGVQEEGVPAAQRVLMSGVPGQAVFALLQYLYTAKCSIPASLQPHVLELASRFDLQELQQLCKFCQEDAATQGEEDDYMNVNNHTDQAFVDLLHSMWNEQDEDEGVDTDRGSDEERGPEGAHQTGDLTADDREIGEEKVNEEELEEIYEFAATQRKMVEEKDIVEEEDEEEEEEEYGEEVFTNLKEPRKSLTGCSIKNLQLDHSLDRSYKRLFSDSWGVYEEGDPSTLPSTSAPAKTHTLQFQQHHPHKPSSELSSRTLLQSSASVVSGISPSPPPTTSNLPVPGQYLSQVGDHGTTVDDPDVPLKRESQGLRSICPPALPPEKKQPELIVLSDSSEEMEVVLSSCSPSPHFPCEGYTQIKPQPALKPSGPTPEIKKSSSLQFSPDDPPAALAHSPVDWSPEVSWLLLSTPLQSGRSNMTTSSTQTRSSMCRTQLFPKGDTSLSLSNRPQSSNSPAGVSAHVGPAEGSILEKVLHSFSSDLNASPKKKSRCEPFAVPSSQSKCSHSSDTPLHLQPQPYSSTPLHTELHQPPALPASSPLHSSLDKQRSVIQGGDRAPPDSPERTDLGSFHLSLLSDPSDPPSSSSHRGLTQRHNDSSRQIRQSVESSNITGGELTSRGRDEESEIECEINDKHDEGEQEEAETGATDVAESSFHQSFMAMDEPPIAFNDSWGLDACVDANPGCFSLRLEDSRGSSRQERSLGQRETAGSSSSTSCHPSPSSPSISLLNGHGSVTPSAPSRAQPSQPSTSAQARTELSFTPSPPDPTTRTTPEINNSLLDSKIWDSWEEEVEEMNPSVQPKTPGSYHNKKCHTLVPITPMPHYSDMDTPELKNKLNRFGVRPLPKRQMILKLKEIHQYTHQLVSSDSEDEAPSAGRAAQMKPLPGSSAAAGNRPLSCAQTVKFKEPQAPAATSPLKHNREEEAEPLSASQGSNTSSTAASEEFERSNPELCPSSDSDSDGGMSASQADLKIQDRLRAVRSFILSDSRLYTQILQYQPLVLSQLQERLKAAGIRLGAAKLVDYLDSQCITFTTAKPGHLAPSRRRGKRTGKGTKTAGESGASRKRAVTAV